MHDITNIVISIRSRSNAVLVIGVIGVIAMASIIAATTALATAIATSIARAGIVVVE